MKKLLIGISLVGLAMGCSSRANTNEKIQAARQAAIDSVNQVVEIERAKQAAIDSVNALREAEIAEAKKVAANQKTIVYRDNYVPVAETKPKKKMNNAAKGALIGAGVGALTGVAVAKNKGQGALIGAGVGAGAGALTGVIVDNSKKKKKP